MRGLLTQIAALHRTDLQLRHGVKWHDGKPFTVADVKCTFDLLQGKAEAKLRVNPRRSWYGNLVEVTANGDDHAVFHLKRPQPALLTLLASGYSPIYPCHVPPAQMRQHPIGTGPFKFVEFKPNESIKLMRNPDYWKPGLPYLDGITMTFDVYGYLMPSDEDDHAKLAAGELSIAG
jgi:peptide/nickel transport system substrate-binding protein